MPTDYKFSVYAAIQSALLANTWIAANVKAGNIHDDRTTGAARRRLAGRAPNDLNPSIDVEVTGGDEGRTTTPNFGHVGTITVTDAIIPCTVVVRITLKFISEKLGNQTSPETHVRQALHQGYPKLSLSYVRDFTVREKKLPLDAMGVTELQMDVTANLRLRISQLRD